MGHQIVRHVRQVWLSELQIGASHGRFGRSLSNARGHRLNGFVPQRIARSMGKQNNGMHVGTLLAQNQPAEGG
jgi:transposase InsO family protein